MEKSEYMNFRDLQASLNVDANSFAIYIKQLFSDLSAKSDSQQPKQIEGEKTISKAVLNNYFNLPTFIKDKFYNLFDKKNAGVINLDSFNKIMTKLYIGSFEETAEIIFNIYDFDNDGLIKKEDVRLMLSFLPLKDNENACKYKSQLESLAELKELLNENFGKGNEQLDFQQFLNIIKKMKSDVYVHLLCFLYAKKPFDSNTINIIKNTNPSSVNMNTNGISKRKSEKMIKKALINNVNSKTPEATDSPKGKVIQIKRPSQIERFEATENILNTIRKFSFESPSNSYLETSSNLTDKTTENTEKAEKNTSLISNIKNMIKTSQEPSPENKEIKGFKRSDGKKLTFKHEGHLGMDYLKKLEPLRNGNCNTSNSNNDNKNNLTLKKNLNNNNELKLPSIFNFSSNNSNSMNSNMEKLSLTSNRSKQNLMIANQDRKLECLDKDKKSNLVINNRLNINEKKDIQNSRKTEYQDKNENLTFKTCESAPIQKNYVENESSNALAKDNFIRNNTIHYEDWLTIRDNLTSKPKKCFVSLNGSELSLYTSDKRNDLISIIHVSGFFIKDGFNAIKIIDKEKYYYFNLFHSKEKTHHFFCKSLESKNKWIEQIKLATGNFNIKDFYDFTDTLGSGAFGIVKKAINLKTNETFAVKIINKANLKEEQINLIKNEIDLLYHFKHPNIVRLYDTFETADEFYLVMEYLAGGDLINYIEEFPNKEIPEKTIAKIAYDIASTISYINSYGVIHRDLKPENIMFSDKSENARIKLIDFGLTRVLSEGESLHDSYGTISYVAPEVLLRKPYNKQIDVWSLGIILYTLLSKGKLPFEDENNDEDIIGKKVLLADPAFPEQLFGKRSKSILLVINDCLNKDPEKRITINSFLKNCWLLSNINK